MAITLTEEQWEEVTRECDAWSDMAATGTTDRAETEAVMLEFYQRIGLEKPEIRWYPGPMACIMAIGEEQVRQGSTKSVKQEALAALSDAFFFGPEWSGWVFRYDMCRKLGVKIDAESNALLGLWVRLSKASGWIFIYEGFCFCAERHKEVTFDVERRLHREAGNPAVVCGDDVTVYAWHGTRLPREWFEPAFALTPEVALKCTNAEHRRCAVEILGWENILQALPNKRIIDEHPDPKIGTLIEVDLPDAPKTRFLRVQCGTGRWFPIPVSSEAQTALQAQAMGYDEPESVIMAIEVRT